MPPQKPSHVPSSSSDLFGRDDSEFLEALGKVDLPVAPLPALKEPSSSSDLFGTEDPTFLDALSRTVLPGEESNHVGVSHIASGSDEEVSKTRKRKSSSSLEDTNLPSSQVVSSRDTPSKDESKDESYMDTNIYGPSKFHGYGEYMYRKRAKLNIQNSELEDTTGAEKSTLFKGLALYINGKTKPSVQELRKLIVYHGGIFHPYLDRKKMVTHIIASNLTPAKVLEFKNMKVVTPEWLLESAKAGAILPWRDFAIGAGNRSDNSQGRMKASQSPATEKDASQRGISSSTAESKPTAKVSPWNEPLQETSVLLSKPSPNTRPLFGTDPATEEEADRIPSYAAHSSNPYAKRKMEDPQWRAEHTAVAPGFIEGYYRHSRLHHLSTWKAELQELVARAAEGVEHGDNREGFDTDSREEMLPGGTGMNGIQFHRPISPNKSNVVATDEQTIMHCDFDSFFVSAGLVDRPHLKGKPVVVCHSQGGQGGVASTSEIASSSYEARKFGVKNGMSLGQARKLCSSLETIPYEFERYKRISLQFYTILMSYADDLQAVSVDEALVDVSSTVRNAQQAAPAHEHHQGKPNSAKELAETIRARVKKVTGCEVSIGISHNILLARVATRRAKPAGCYHILTEEVADILAPLDIEDLRGFGWSTRSKLEAKFGVTTLGELAKRPKGALCDVLGKKTGETLWKAIRGIDDTKIESDRVRKSVSCEINYGIRFQNGEEADTFIRGMAKEVSDRLAKLGMCGRSLTLKVMTRDPKAPVEAPKFLGHGLCETTTKTATFAGPGGRATAESVIIGECAWKLLSGMHIDPKELRGIGIHIQKLEKVSEAANVPYSPGQTVLNFKKASGDAPTTPQMEKHTRPAVVIDPPSQDPTVENHASPSDNQYLKPGLPGDVLPSFSQVDPTFLDALPADIRIELEREYMMPGSGDAVAGPSRHTDTLPASKQPPADIVRIVRQLAPKSRPAISPSKTLHPLFAKRAASNTLKVGAAELKLLNIDAEVWVELPIELQREQLAALRAANVGTGMAVRASMSTQAKQERILNRWRTRRSPSVGIRGQRLDIFAKMLELPGLKQRGTSKSDELRVNETEDIQAVISQWVEGFGDEGPREGDVEYFGKFLTRCMETDMGAERGVRALKWWRVLLRQRWSDLEGAKRPEDNTAQGMECKAGWCWWDAFWEIKKRMDGVIKKRYGGGLSLK